MSIIVLRCCIYAAASRTVAFFVCCTYHLDAFCTTQNPQLTQELKVNSQTAKYGDNCADYRSDLTQLYPGCKPNIKPLIRQDYQRKSYSSSKCITLYDQSSLISNFASVRTAAVTVITSAQADLINLWCLSLYVAHCCRKHITQSVRPRRYFKEHYASLDVNGCFDVTTEYTTSMQGELELIRGLCAGFDAIDMLPERWH
jgi:hypothetical protein